jgi:hypothetical protein
MGYSQNRKRRRLTPPFFLGGGQHLDLCTANSERGFNDLGLRISIWELLIKSFQLRALN